MKTFKYITLFAVIILLSSCEKVIEFDGETKTPKIVVNSLFNTEDTFTVHLSNSLALVDDGNLKPLKNAVLKLYDSNNQLVSTPTHDADGYYIDTAFKFFQGQEYRLSVENEGLTSIETKDAIPTKVAISKIDTQDVVNSDGWEQKQVELTFNDPTGTNYYMVEVRINFIYKNDPDVVYSNWQTAYISSLDPNIATKTGNGEFYAEQMILADSRFDGKEYTFRFNMDKWYLDEQSESKVYVRLYSLSESAYNYFTSLQRYQQVQGDFFATPVQVYSNVEGGFGIFGGASIESIQLK